jgi:aspartate/methionine/tyrosine aminotransferase
MSSASEQNSLIHRAVSVGEETEEGVLTVKEALRVAANTTDPDLVKKVLEIEGVNAPSAIDDVLKAERNGVEQIIQWSADDGETWHDERRVRTLLPDSFDQDAVYQRLLDLPTGESLEFSGDLPETVIGILIEYADRGFISFELNGVFLTNTRSLRGLNESDLLEVKKLKDEGILKTVVKGSVRESLQYRIRSMGVHSDAMQKIDPSRVPRPERIGNVPVNWDQPDFAIGAEFDKRYPIDPVQFAAYMRALTEMIENGASAEEVDRFMIRERVTNRYNNAILEYPPTSGTIELGEYVLGLSRHMAKEHKVAPVLRRDGIIPVAGAAHGILNVRFVVAGHGRILHILPSYPPQFEFELFFARQRDPSAQPIGSAMVPDRDEGAWKIDFDDLKEKVADPSNNVKVISIVNPNNPTGAVTSLDELMRLYEIAKEHKLIVEIDETYWQIINPTKDVSFVSGGVLSAMTGVPTVVFRSVSKDLMRCGEKFGWMEFYNPKNDPQVGAMRDACLRTQMEMVGATRTPQDVVPAIYKHQEFPRYMAGFNSQLGRIGDEVADYFSQIDSAFCIPSEGAMYTTLVFEDEALNDKQTLPIEHPGIRKYVEECVRSPECSLDERFALYVMAVTGLEFTPLSTGFMANLEKPLGIRACNLTRDDDERRRRYEDFVAAANAYITSA